MDGKLNILRHNVLDDICTHAGSYLEVNCTLIIMNPQVFFTCTNLRILSNHEF